MQSSLFCQLQATAWGTLLATALPLHCHCTAIALPLHCHCTATALPLHCHCTATALPLHCHCTATALPPAARSRHLMPFAVPMRGLSALGSTLLLQAPSAVLHHTPLLSQSTPLRKQLEQTHPVASQEHQGACVCQAASLWSGQRGLCARLPALTTLLNRSPRLPLAVLPCSPP